MKTIFKTLQQEVLLHKAGRLTHAGDELTYLGKIIGERLRGVEKGRGVDMAVVHYTLEQEEQAVTLPIEEFKMKLDKLLTLSHGRADVQHTAMMIARHARHQRAWTCGA